MDDIKTLDAIARKLAEEDRASGTMILRDETAAALHAVRSHPDYHTLFPYIPCNSAPRKTEQS